MEKIERLQKAYNYLYDNGIVHSKAELALKMGRERSNVSAAYHGRTPFFNDRFLVSFCDTFDVISRDWLIYGEGDMLAKDMDRPKPEPKPQEEIRHTATIVELYAQLIKEVESIRRELTSQLERTQQLNDHLEAQISRLEALGLSTEPSAPFPSTQPTDTLRFARHGHNAVSYALTDLPESKPLSVAEQPISGHETAENKPTTASTVYPSKPSKRKPRSSAPASASPSSPATSSASSSPSSQATSSASSSVPGLPDHIYRQQPKPSNESPSSTEAPESHSDPSCTPD